MLYTAKQPQAKTTKINRILKMNIKVIQYYDSYNLSYFNLDLPDNSKITLNDNSQKGLWTAYKDNEARNDVVSITHEAREKIKFLIK